MSLYSISVRNPLLATISNHLDGYPTPANLSYLWGFGSLAGMALVIQIITGVLLAMHYAPETHLAFASVEHIMRDVRGGAALRYVHANGASMFFIVVYIHMFRGLYYGSYFQPRANLWYSGVVIFFLMVATAFTGYVLPWGQMSFWGATVITNLFSALPGVGASIVQLLWGGFSVDNPTLNRFFSLHYLLPFVLAGLALLHLILLHLPGSNNPLGVNAIYDRIPFYPYFYVKDFFGFLVFVLVFSLFVVYAPNYLGHPDNYIEANPLVTPAHIVPEWYFLPFYAILRTIPDKLGGVLLMGTAIVVLAFLPVVDTSVFRSSFFKPLNVWFFWFFFSDTLSLGWIGQEIVESPFIEMANFVTLSFFLYFLFFLPVVGFIETTVVRFELRFAALPVGVLTTYVYEPVHVEKVYLDEFAAAYIEAVGSQLFWSSCYSWFHFFQIAMVAVFLLTLGMFFPKSAEFTRFLNSVGFAYILFNIWNSASSIVVVPQLPTGLPEPNSFRGDETKDFIQMTAQWMFPAKDEVLSWGCVILQENSLIFNLFAVYASLIVSVFFYGIADRFFVSNGAELEFPILILFIHLGALLLLRLHTIIDLILALETITLASYVLAAFERKNRFSAYAGVQYFILGSIPSGMLVLGAGLLYQDSGAFTLQDLRLFYDSFMQEDFARNQSRIANFWLYSSSKPFVYISSWDEVRLKVGEVLGPFVLVDKNPMIKSFTEDRFYEILLLPSEFNLVLESASSYTMASVLGVLLIVSNLFFKLTAAPFHFWAPSVYGKAPVASVTFLSVFLKGIVLFFIVKLFFGFFSSFSAVLLPFFLFCGIISVLFGMFGAFVEKTTKRFFVYSSMGHVGFMLVGLSVGNLDGFSAALHYFAIYAISSFLMWFILMHMGRSSTHLVQFKFLKSSDPLLGLIFAMLVFSMSGLPPFGGFFVKLDVLVALVDSSRFYANYLLFFFTVASFFYYLRLIKIIFFDANENRIEEVKYRNDGRLWLISVLYIVLLFYIFLVQRPLLFIQTEALASAVL